MGPAPPPQRSGMPGWLIGVLVAVGLLVVMVSVMAMLAWYGVRKYLAASKTAEALNGVGMIARDAESSYAANGTLCKSATSPVPASMMAVAGHKYMSNPSDWTHDPADTGFTCIGYEMSYPQYYQYDYERTASDSFVAYARGDLDGNGVTSEFSDRGDVVSGTVVVDPSVKQTNPNE